MNVLESVRISWRSIASHKLRSTLTTLGVIIGVAAVIVFMVLGGALTEDIVGDLDELDAPGMQVSTQTNPENGFAGQFVTAPIYTEHDVAQVESIDGVSGVAPVGGVPVTQVGYGDQRVTGVVTVQATTDAYFLPEEFVDGEPFAMGADEVVINVQATRLFDGIAVGDEVTLSFPGDSTATVTVVGIIEEPVDFGRGPVFYLPTDPFYTTTIDTPRGTTERAYPSLIVGAERPEDVDRVQAAVTEYFEGDADAASLKQDDHVIAVQTIDDAVEQISDILSQITVFIAGIAAIALVVGSIGIANIMIVSVTERTREIGIMKAVGARRRDIVQLFLVESAILGVIGAIVGVAVGVGVGYLLVNWIGWPMVYPLDWIAIAIAVGVAVGILSGLYPAWRAATLDPIESLRHE